ncbi:unnamed protein product [Kuraishia capsulata CBS 1993]|uniref:amidase n=1 Tax=Kuraishia capsulata CBS 1993 TaxID=1382522 RepID=W6MQQ3_9ASCO|nr:uncharacterized protein KUCA_T00004662001 [Kuraishia capsulata CBS 1993]CDK28678.1 unnamed protein product [Kuraishia capsulata CBS 1993]
MSNSYLEVAASKRESNLAKIPKEWLLKSIPPPEEVPNVSKFLPNILSDQEMAIITSTATELVATIADGKLTALEVTKAFCHSAAVNHQLTRCLSELFFDKAIERATELDAYFNKNGHTVGPLHGLPISLKDQVNLKGVSTSIGFIAPFMAQEYADAICGYDDSNRDKDSLIAQSLAKAGAVFYVKTTVPMAMLGYDTRTTLFGKTLNSINRKLSPGGSSGGEASLIGGLGSVVGLGTDIGGSIRGPSAFQGLYGLRASTDRFSYLNVSNSYPHQPILKSVIGPIAKNLEDLKLVSKTIINSNEWEEDPKVIPIPWRETELGNDLSFGIMEWDGVVYPHPPITRALKMVEKALQLVGYDTIDFVPPIKHQGSGGPLDLLIGIFTSDSLLELEKYCAMSGEPMNDLLSGFGVKNKTLLNVAETWEQSKEKYKIQLAYDEGVRETRHSTKSGKPIDCFITPGWGSTSYISGENFRSPSTYTRYLNVLDYSVITIPVTHVDKEIDLPHTYSPTNELDRANYENYDPELTHGMPVTLQLVCGRYQEEKCVALAEKVVEALKSVQ